MLCFACAVVGLLIGLVIITRLIMKMTSGVCTSDKKMHGMTTLITGGSSGIGKETALDLASRGSRVIITSINMDEANTAKQEIIDKTGNQNIVAMYLDLRSFKNVRSFADKIIEQENNIDVLLNNAGVGGPAELTITEDGIEAQMQTNYFGAFLLTHLLLPLLKKSGSRIVNVISALHLHGEINLKNLRATKPFSQFGSYCNSKLALLLFTQTLGAKMSNTGVTVNCVHPGLVNTTIFKYGGFFTRNFMYIFNTLTMKTPKEGAQTSIHVCVSDKVKGVTGRYFSDCEPVTYWIHRSSKDKELAKKLWVLSEEITGVQGFMKTCTTWLKQVME